MHPSSGQPPEYGGSQQPEHQPPGQDQHSGWGPPPPPADPYAAPPNDPYAPPPATPHSEPTMLDAFGRPAGQDPFAAPPSYDPFGQQTPPPGPGSPGHYPPPGMYPLSPAPGSLPPGGVPGAMPPGMVPPPVYGPPEQSKTNGFALAALILGILAPCGGALLSLIFGFVALSQIKKRGQRGRGMAIGGIVTTVAWLLIGGIVLVIALVFAPDDSEGGDVPSTNLQVGDCVEQVPQSATVISLPTVPCSTPHEAEVYALFDLADGDFPGDSAVVNQADDGCRVRLEAGFPDAFNDPGVEIYYLYPTSSSWEDGDREVVCMAYYPDGPRTDSLGG